MEREIMPDYRAETFYRYLIPENIFEGYDKPPQEASRCASLCKEMEPNVFGVRKGAVVAGGVRNFFNDEASLIVPSSKVTF